MPVPQTEKERERERMFRHYIDASIMEAQINACPLQQERARISYTTGGCQVVQPLCKLAVVTLNTCRSNDPAILCVQFHHRI
jgi:hypothetical protein